MARGKRLDVAWLEEHYPMMTTIDGLLDDYEAEFGWRPTRQAVYVKASRMGLRKAPVEGRGAKCERVVRWSKEPEMEAWMLENDRGQRIDLLVAKFCARFGFRLTRGQVNLFRASHGTQKRRSHGGGKPQLPVGTERVTKDGYVVIKFAERPNRSMSKDNWKLKHVWAWEQEHGPLPVGHAVYFADGDNRNFSPDNLVAVPMRLVGPMSQLRSEGTEWHDAETLRAVMAMAEIRATRNEVVARQPRTCKCCGRTFTNEERHRSGGSAVTTICPECGARNRRPPKYDRAEMRMLRREGLSYGEIAERMGCSPHTAWKVLAETGKD